MPIGPLRRLVGALGLAGLVPPLSMVLLGTLSPVDAAVRAVVMVLGLLIVGRLVGWGVRVLAAEVELEDGDVAGEHAAGPEYAAAQKR